MRRSGWGSFFVVSKGQVLNMKDRSFLQLTPEIAPWRQCYRDHNSKGIARCQQKLQHWRLALSAQCAHWAPLPRGETMVRFNGGSISPQASLCSAVPPLGKGGIGRPTGRYRQLLRARRDTAPAVSELLGMEIIGFGHPRTGVPTAKADEV